MARLPDASTVTDCAAAPQLLANCRRALELNEVRAAVLGLSWGLVSPELLQLPPLQFVLGSDVFYDEPLFEDVLRSVAFLLETSPRAEFVFSYQERSSERCLEPLLAKWDMQARQVPLARRRLRPARKPQRPAVRGDTQTVAGEVAGTVDRHGLRLCVVTLSSLGAGIGKTTW